MYMYMYYTADYIISDDGRLYLTSDAPVRRHEATWSKEIARESDLANAHENEETTGTRADHGGWHGDAATCTKSRP